MSPAGSVEVPHLSWGVAALTIAGEVVSGDLHVVIPFAGGVVLGAIDGLGHGAEAAVASRLAASTISAEPSVPVGELLRRCHQAMRRSRGAAMSLLSLQLPSGKVSWAGVGNVEGVLLRARGQPTRERVPLRGGVVGYQLPSFTEQAVTVAPGDTLLLATDGIASGFADRLSPHGTPQELADRVLATSGTGSDDALVLVARVEP